MGWVVLKLGFERETSKASAMPLPVSLTNKLFSAIFIFASYFLIHVSTPLYISSLVEISALPLIVNWGVWLTRNLSIFQDKPTFPEIVTAQGLSILSHFPQEKGTAPIRVIQEEEVDKSRPWAFFDGASQNNFQSWGAVLYLSENHFFKIRMGLGSGTTNYAELMSLKLLLLFAAEKGVSSVQVFSDSMTVIIGREKHKNVTTCFCLFCLKKFSEHWSILTPSQCGMFTGNENPRPIHYLKKAYSWLTGNGRLQNSKTVNTLNYTTGPL